MSYNGVTLAVASIHGEPTNLKRLIATFDHKYIDTEYNGLIRRKENNEDNKKKRHLSFKTATHFFNDLPAWSFYVKNSILDEEKLNCIGSQG